MLVMFECTVVGQRLRNLRELRSLTVPKQALLVYRQGRWDQLPGDALLPGDVISIGRPSGGTPMSCRMRSRAYRLCQLLRRVYLDSLIQGCSK